jgi:hypothetical protein
MEAEKGIFINYKIDERGTQRYQVYSCSCAPDFYGPYEQMILHLRHEHKFTIQEAEVAVHYAKKPTIDPEDWMR